MVSLSASMVASPFALADAEHFVEKALDRALEERALAVIRIPAPTAPLDTMLRTLRKAPSVLWAPPRGGGAAASHGAAVTMRLRGPNRFTELRERSASLFAEVLRMTHPDAAPASTKLYGGMAFSPGGAEAEPWTSFSDGCFILPRFTYEPDGDATTLQVVADCRDGWAGRKGLVRAELRTVWETLAHPPSRTPHRPLVGCIRHIDPARYRAQVEAITHGIAEDRIEKVVLSRQARVHTHRDLDAWGILEQLGVNGGGTPTWRFGIRLGQSTLIGATPERLLVKSGRAVGADALAGSISAEVGGADAALLASEKDRREHAFVVRHLIERLSPFCTQLGAAASPSIRRLPNLLHLYTPVRGSLRSDVRAADLVAAVHPTPAVGGTPTESAAHWIQEREPAPRGWYGGPVGWIDHEDNAEMVVALRCGVIRGAAAWLHAGGGIVRGSLPDAEWEESALKFAPLLSAIGV